MYTLLLFISAISLIALWAYLREVRKHLQDKHNKALIDSARNRKNTTPHINAYNTSVAINTAIEYDVSINGLEVVHLTDEDAAAIRLIFTNNNLKETS